MHRSGTSALAGSLEQHGLHLGTVSTRDTHNVKGNRESAELRRLNEDVLRTSGGAWRAPPPVVEWRPEHLERARRAIAKHAGRPAWGFKDPRTLMTLEGWLTLIPDLELVGVFRHPSRVARSLERRDGFDREAAVALWTAYNTRLRDLHEQRCFPLLCFDDDPSELQRKLDEAARSLGLHDSAADEPFFASALRDDVPVEPAPPAAEDLYEDLRARAL